MSTFTMFRNQPVETFLPDAVIFQQGDPRTVMYVVTEGEGPNGVFGEMATVDGQARTATAVARTACKLVPIDQRRFEFLVQQTPFFAIEVMRVLVARLRRVDQSMAA